MKFELPILPSLFTLDCLLLKQFIFCFLSFHLFLSFSSPLPWSLLSSVFRSFFHPSEDFWLILLHPPFKIFSLLFLSLSLFLFNLFTQQSIFFHPLFSEFQFERFNFLILSFFSPSISLSSFLSLLFCLFHFKFLDPRNEPETKSETSQFSFFLFLFFPHFSRSFLPFFLFPQSFLFPF